MKNGLFILCLFFSALFARDAYGSDKHVVLVKLRDGASVSQRMVRGDLPVLTRERFVAEMKSANSSVQRRFIGSLPEGEIKVRKQYWISNTLSCETDDEGLARLASHPDVEYVVVDSLQKIIDFTPCAAPASESVAAHVQMVNAQEANEAGYSGEGVVVAIIDSGVNYNHADLQGSLWESDIYPNHGWDFFNNDDDPMDDMGHGTHCAGVVAGNGASGTRTGIAPDAEIMILKVVDDQGEGTQEQVFEAIEFAVENGADVLSMSLGWPNVGDANRKLWRDVMTNLLDCNVLAVVAAGNEGNKQGQYPVPYNLRTPGDCPPAWLAEGQCETVGGLSSVFTVGSVDEDGITVSSTSARGPVTWKNVETYNDYSYNPGNGLMKPDITAPGASVVSLDYSNVNGYVAMSGTSMACPCVAGIVADMLSKNEGLSPSDIVRLVSESAVKLTSQFSNNSGAGRADALFAVLNTPNEDVNCIMMGEFDGAAVNDAKFKAGKKVTLSFKIENNSSEDISGYDIKVEALSPSVMVDEVRTPSVTIAANAITELRDAAVLTVDAGALSGDDVILSLSVVCGGKTYSNLLRSEVTEPLLMALPLAMDETDGNGNGMADPGESLLLTFGINNVGNEPCANAVATLVSESPYLDFESLSDASGDIVGSKTYTAALRVSSETPEWYATDIALHVKADNIDTLFTYTVNVGKVGALVVDRSKSEKGQISAEAIADAFGQIDNFSYELADELPDDLSGYYSVWYCAGVYPYNRSLASDECDLIRSYVADGGRFYLEGGDVWYNKSPSVNDVFHVSVIADDGGEPGRVEGCLELFNEREFFDYSYPAKFIDHIEPADSSAVALYRVASPAEYTVAVGRTGDGSEGSTIASSVEMGGTMSAKDDMLRSCMSFFGFDFVEVPDADETYFFCDFQNNSAAGFSIYDLDDQEPHFTMVQAGFEKGKGWVEMHDTADYDNICMVSTSKYEDGDAANPSDDWLITPAIDIRGNNAVLSWKAIVPDKWYERDGYSVYVSEQGNRPENFTSAPVFSIEEESSSAWTEHSVSLESFAGKTVYIAFVNDSHNKYMLAVDDIKVEGEKTVAEIEAISVPYSYGEDAVDIKARLFVYSEESLTEFDAYCEVGDNVYSKHFDGFSLKKGQSFDFAFDERIPVAVGDSVKYEVWAEMDGGKTNVSDGCIVSYAFKPSNRVVVEEATGMWCSYCPQGTVALDWLSRKYPDNFIGIAIHYDDPLALDAYSDALGFVAWPAARVNRGDILKTLLVMQQDDKGSYYTMSGGGVEDYFVEEMNTVPECDVEMGVTMDGGKVDVSVAVTPAIDLEGCDYRPAFVLTEELVHSPSYYQMNSYSGIGAAIGGFESLPDRIEGDDIIFSHVARGIWPSAEGLSGVLPSDMEHGVRYEADYAIDIPGNVATSDNVDVTVLLLDAKTGRIVNAAKWDNPNKHLGLEEQAAGTEGVSFRKIGDEGILSLPESAEGSVRLSVVSPDGKIVSTHEMKAHGGEVRFPAGNLDGVYIIHAETGDAVFTLKAVL